MVTFSTTPQTLGSLPKDPELLIAEADEFINNITKSWKKNKTYHSKLHKSGKKEEVTTYGKTIEKEYWLARISEHSTHDHNDFVEYLVGSRDANGEIVDLYNHCKHEPEYIEVLDKWEPIPLESYEGFSSLSPDIAKRWVSIKAFYELGAPLTTREFNEFLFLSPPKESDPSQTGYVIQFVADKALESHNVHGVYCSIERVRMLENGHTEWVMATTSDSGGNVPKWLQNSMISKAVSSDVPAFLNWLETKKSSK